MESILSCHVCLPAQGRMVWWTSLSMTLRCVDAGAGPRRRSLGAGRLRRRFPARSPGDGSAIAGRMESAVHFPSLAVPGSLQGRSVQTGRAHVAAPITTPVRRLPAMPLVAPTDNIRVFPRWSPRAILLASKQSNIPGGSSVGILARDLPNWCGRGSFGHHSRYSFWVCEKLVKARWLGGWRASA